MVSKATTPSHYQQTPVPMPAAVRRDMTRKAILSPVENSLSRNIHAFPTMTTTSYLMFFYPH